MPALTTALALVVAAPVVEELAFRAGLQEAMLRALERRAARGPSGPSGAPRAWIANVITALVFALAHGIHRGAWLGVATLPFALAIGALYRRSRRVLPCIAVHALLNASWLALAPIAPRIAG